MTLVRAAPRAKLWSRPVVRFLGTTDVVERDVELDPAIRRVVQQLGRRAMHIERDPG